MFIPCSQPHLVGKVWLLLLLFIASTFYYPFKCVTNSLRSYYGIVIASYITLDNSLSKHSYTFTHKYASSILLSQSCNRMSIDSVFVYYLDLFYLDFWNAGPEKKEDYWNGVVEKKENAKRESKSSRKKKDKSSKGQKDSQDQSDGAADVGHSTSETVGTEKEEDASATDVKERLKKITSMKKKKSSKEMDAAPRAAANEAAARNAKLAAAKKKEKAHYNQQPVQ